MELRWLGRTGLKVSALGLGTVKLGRSQGLKYPQTFTIPDDRDARHLLARARDLGINFLDTAPAYGTSEERLGELLAGQRHHWVLATKVGESFAAGISSFDFRPDSVRRSVLASLRRLRTDYLDLVLIHSDGSDCRILEEEGTLEMLQELRRQGWLRACGISSKTIAGGMLAAQRCDVLMLSYSQEDRSQLPVLESCVSGAVGVLVKKPLASGHLGGREQAASGLRFALAGPGVSSAVVGTVNPLHLEQNVQAVESLWLPGT